MLHTQILFLKRINSLMTISFAMLAGLFVFAINPMVEPNTHAEGEPGSDEVVLSMSTSDINMAVNVTNPNGTFSASTPASISVSTSNATGYTLSIASTSGETGLIGDGYAIDSILVPTEENNFNNGEWGILPSKINSAANDLYQPAPDNTGVVIDATSAANSTDNVYTLSVGAKLGYETPAGVYTNTFVVSATANPVAWSLIYDDDEGAISNVPANSYGASVNDEIIVSDQIPTRTGYDFCFWCSGNVTTVDGVDSCGDTVYEPGDTIPLGGVNTFILKSMWSPTTYSITYDLDGGSVATANPDDYTILSSDITLSKPTRSGYRFLGWTGTDLSEPTKDVTIPEGSVGDRTYTATWELKTCAFETETIPYSGDVYPWTVPTGCAGDYKLEVWGAQGGRGGKGGYSYGTVTLDVGDTLYVVVGGQGTYSTAPTGGYNGGGRGGSSSNILAGGGGGATHIATELIDTGVLSKYASNRDSVLLVAGGGGGYGGDLWNGYSGGGGGAGGGENGGNGGTNYTQYEDGGSGGAGATQTTGNAFGQGANSGDPGSPYRQTRGGGGGGWYGGKIGTTSYTWSSGGGGGSGHIGNVTDGATEAGVQTGNGQAVITLLDE